MFIIAFLIFNNLFSGFSFPKKFNSSYGNFKILETKHFRVWYPQNGIADKEEIKSYASDLAKTSEAAYNVLSKDLDNEIFLKINITVLNNSDLANGESWPIPQTNIYVYTSPPNISSPVKEYRDWLWELMVHELTHSISFSTTRGYSTFLRAIMGTIITVNAVWPLNLTEGLAVYEETHFSEMGRGRSDLYNSLMLGLVNEKESNLKLSISPYYTELWPWGNIPYLYGYTVFAEFAKDDPKLPGKFSKYSAGRLPQFIDGSFKNINDRYILELWQDAIKNIIKWKRNLQNTIAQKRISKIETIEKNKNKEINLLTISPDQKYIAYYNTNIDHRSTIDILSTKDFSLVKQIHSLNTNFIDWNKNEILYNSLNFTPWGNYYILKSYNIKTDEHKTYPVEHINLACRINDREIAISKRLIDKQILYIWNIENNSYQEIYKPRPRNGAIQLLKCKKNEIIFTAKIRQTHLVSYNIKSKKLSRIIKTKYQIHDLELKNNDIYILTRANHLPNVIKFSKNNYRSFKRSKNNTYKTKRLTNFLKGIKDFTINKNTILTAYYDTQGVSFGKTKIKEESFLLNAKDTSPFKFTKYKKNKKIKNIEIEEASVFWSTLGSMIPKFWTPRISLDTSNNINLGVYTIATDPTFRNQYDIGFDKSLNSDYMQFFTNYTNHYFYPSINLGFAYERYTSNYRTTTAYATLSRPFVINTDVFNTDYIYLLLFAGIDFKEEKNGTKSYQDIFYTTGFTLNSSNSSMGSYVNKEQGFDLYFAYNFAKNNNHYFQEVFNIYLPLSSHTVFNIGYSGFHSSSDNSQTAVGGSDFNTILETTFNTVSLKGYPVGYIIAKETNAIYSSLTLPLFNMLFGGDNLFPLFMKKMYFKLMYKNVFTLNQNFESYGSELHFKNDIFYLVPIDISLGFHYAKQLNSYSLLIGLEMGNLF